jgi:general secretion pathway protein N
MALSWRRSARPPTRWPGSGFAESTLAQAAWERTRKAVARWGWAGLLCGAAAALLAFAPATWLADAVAARTQNRLLLADARGTVWNGSAVPVLTGGPDSRSAAMLPGRTGWSIGLRGLALELRLRQPCCIADELVLLLRPSLGGLSVQLLPGSGQMGEWPAAWLSGLGAPWNTLQLSGTLRLSSSGLSLQMAAGRWNMVGKADVELSNAASALTQMDRLGSYRVHLEGAAGQPPAFTLSTLDGALLINGSGQWTGSQLRFRGEARAAPGAEGELDNLLNFFGRRQGALSLISIG